MKAFLIVSVSVLIGLAITHASLRFYGLSQPITPPHGAFFSEAPQRELIAFRAAARGSTFQEPPPNTFMAFDRITKELPNAIIDLDLRTTKEFKLIVFAEDALESTTDRKGYLVVTDWSEVQKAFVEKTQEKVPLLEEVLNRYPKSRFIIRLRTSEPQAVEKLAELLKKPEYVERAAVSPDTPLLSKKLRDLNPQIILGSSPSDIMRTSMLATLSLEVTDGMVADLQLSPLLQNKIAILNAAIVAEIHRRQKKLYVGPLETKEEIQSARDLGADGFISQDLELLKASDAH